MVLDESFPCKESSMSQSKAWRITGWGWTGERNYRVGLEPDHWVPSEVQMVTQGSHWRCLLFLYFSWRMVEELFWGSLHWKKCCFSEEVFHWTKLTYIDQRQKFTITWGISGIFRAVREVIFFFLILSVWSLLCQIFHYLIKSVSSEALSQIVIHIWTWPCNRDWQFGLNWQGGLACCDSWGHKESDRTERLNWTELNWMQYIAQKNWKINSISILL